MNEVLNDADYELFRKIIYDESGITFSDTNRAILDSRIKGILREKNIATPKDYYALITKNKEEMKEMLDSVTTNLTRFFRNQPHFDAFEKYVIPNVVEMKKSKGIDRTIRIWSAGCSTGEEPYSLAMTLDELLPPNSYEIIASDLDKAVLKKAEQGIYRLQNFDVIPNNYKKWFTYLGDERYAISDTIKSRVTFKQLDLLKDGYPRDVDLILCRNVLIYLIEEAKDEIYVKFSRSLVKKGILFVGSSEQIVNCKQFGLEAIKTYFYEKMC